MPKNRSSLYLIWRVCERFKILPPEIKNEFDTNNAWQIAQLMGYEQIRQLEEQEQAMLGAMKKWL